MFSVPPKTNKHKKKKKKPLDYAITVGGRIARTDLFQFWEKGLLQLNAG